MAKKDTHLRQTGEEVQVLLDKIEDWVLATTEDILALFGIGGGNIIQGNVLILADANTVSDDIVFFNDATTINANNINLY